ncbi:LPXTG cell wall anchor domain-containing protein, partial [Enterococcus durans]|uniref:LPXTG cell wall anchor domain-containing protein n=1 Tax=Enterococcus durans TaxID=53345 RepID=UPI001D09E687
DRGKVGGTSPKTGDNSNRMFYLSMAGLSAGALVALFLTEKNEERITRNKRLKNRRTKVRRCGGGKFCRCTFY